jgi:hypothetical protein
MTSLMYGKKLNLVEGAKNETSNGNSIVRWGLAKDSGSD